MTALAERVDEKLIQRARAILGMRVKEQDAIKTLTKTGVSHQDAYLAVKAAKVLLKDEKAPLEFELSEAVVQEFARLLNNSDLPPAQEELTEAAHSMRLNGYLVTRGFGKEVALPDEMKFRISAAKVSGRVRVILDIY